MDTRIFVVVIALVAIAAAGSIRRDDIRRAFGQNCENGYSLTCLKIDLISFAEKFSDKDEINLFSGISVARNSNASEVKTSEIIAEVARSFPNDSEQRLNGYIVAKIGNFLDSHHLKLNLFDSNTVEVARSAFSGRKKFGKKGGLEALLAAGVMMKGTIMAIGMGAIALMAGKALLTGLLALTLSAILGLKALASGGGKSTTYEIVAKPVYSSSHSHSVSHEDHGSHGSGGGGGNSGYGTSYGRSLNFELPSHLKEPL